MQYYDEEDKKEYYKVELYSGLDGRTLMSGFNEKWDAVNWIITHYLKGT